MDPSVLPIRLRAAMDMKGFKQADLARASGVTKPQISLILGGARLPTVSTLYLLSRALEVSTDYLLGIDPPEFLAEICEHSRNRELLFRYSALDSGLKELAREMINLLHSKLSPSGTSCQ